jgi:hypothetical protein
MAKELRGPLEPSQHYPEYVLFCEQEGIVPVVREDFTPQLWLDICIEYRLANAINDENGVPWAEYVRLYGNMYARGPITKP